MPRSRREVEGRVEELARSVRRLRVALVGVGLLAGTLAVTALAPPDAGDGHFGTLRAERLDIVAPDGTRRLVLSNRERFPDPVLDGETFERSIHPAVLVLADAEGNPRIRLRVTEEGEADVEVLDAAGEVISRLGPDASG